MELFQHVGSSVEGIGNKSSLTTQRSTSINLHVRIHLGCNLCSSGVPELEVGMDISENLCEHLLQTVFRL